MRIRASVICLHENKILVFKGVDPISNKNYWFLPGGKVEKDETPSETARREAFEETGYKIQILQESEITKEYSHWWNGSDHLCKTYFYRGLLVGAWTAPQVVKDADYNKGAEWLNLEEAISFFAYTKEIQEAVVALTV